jgi:hypothetical protein
MIPKAKYMAWVNIVKECRITIKYTTSEERSAKSPERSLTTNKDHYSRQLDSKNGEIRLILVKPGKFDDEIKCSWETAMLDDGPIFSALSYCWGGDQTDYSTFDMETPEDTTPRPFRVTKAVEQAIRRLRHTETPLRIWIDAMCINQTDMEERSQQVALMRSIYSRAENVRIWLGEGEPAVDACLKIIRDIYNYNYRSCSGGDACLCPGTKHSLALAEVDAAIEEKDGGISFKGMREVFQMSQKGFTEDELDWAGGRYSTQLSVMLAALFSNAWFSRVWVVQEATLARRALIHSSGECILWDEVLQIGEWLESPEFGIEQQHVQAQTVMAPIWRTVQESHRQRQKHEEEAYDSDLESGLIFSCSRHPHNRLLEIFLGGHDLRATDPRDKIFALLSFGGETSDIGQLDDLIRPSYSKPTGQVFADFTRWWIQKHRSLDILSAIHSESGRTWQRTMTTAPKAANEKRHATWAVGSQGQSRWRKASLQAQFNFRATGDSAPDLSLLEAPADPLTLRLRGRVISRIKAISYAPIEWIYPYNIEEGKRRDIQSVFHKILDPCGFTGFWSIKTIKDSHEDTASRAQTAYLDHVRAHWNYATRPMLKALVPNNQGDGMHYYETDKVPMCMNKCFFVTEVGSFGLCPWTAKEGDVIVLLDGGNVPYLLRRQDVAENGKQNEVFEFVGECFVDGIMRGEYMKSGDGDGHVFDIV